MLIVIAIAILIITFIQIASNLLKGGRSYKDLSISNIGTYFGQALVPGIIAGMVTVWAVSSIYPVEKIGHPFAPSYAVDLVYKIRIKMPNNQELIGDAYLYYDRDPGEGECVILVEKITINRGTYEVDFDNNCCSPCFEKFGEWVEFALVGHGNVEAMLLNEKVGEW
ncbi:hypothetical protein QWY85_09730 [Neolewinella lacunae]|uniref:Uncharacterized protein n=1 Tax=Neolewinella lacunae TaxID=1517758 RepID=A0A923PHR5_9BACT|nr:hypothetical protein [Neolewinella lacunae]MBC6994305.1 hypothetical protein [Neolewinella lacunae]MDN3634938.1 hypothetical protein [Neolewinella lacunae]